MSNICALATRLWVCESQLTYREFLAAMSADSYNVPHGSFAAIITPLIHRPVHKGMVNLYRCTSVMIVLTYASLSRTFGRPTLSMNPSREYANA